MLFSFWNEDSPATLEGIVFLQGSIFLSSFNSILNELNYKGYKLQPYNILHYDFELWKGVFMCIIISAENRWIVIIILHFKTFKNSRNHFHTRALCAFEALQMMFLHGLGFQDIWVIALSRGAKSRIYGT